MHDSLKCVSPRDPLLLALRMINRGKIFQPGRHFPKNKDPIVPQQKQYISFSAVPEGGRKLAREIIVENAVSEVAHYLADILPCFHAHFVYEVGIYLLLFLCQRCSGLKSC